MKENWWEGSNRMDSDRRERLDLLQGALSWRFNEPEILDMALTHRSYLNENPDLDCCDNERLEFLGDAVLELCITDLLIRSFSDATEGVLSKLRASLVNEQSLSVIASDFHLGDYLLLGKGEESSGGRNKNSILANTFEAVTGALFLDRGYDAVCHFIGGIFEPIIMRSGVEPVYVDYKSLLQELCQHRFRTIPVYTLTGEYGPDHDKSFEVSVTFGTGMTKKGSGKSKKLAEQDAAESAYRDLVKSE